MEGGVEVPPVKLEVNECQRHRKLKLIKTLLENSVNPEDTDKREKTCLHFFRSRSIDVKDIIIDKYREKSYLQLLCQNWHNVKLIHFYIVCQY